MSLTFGYAIFSLSCRTSWCVRYVAVAAPLILSQTALGATRMSIGILYLFIGSLLCSLHPNSQDIGKCTYISGPPSRICTDQLLDMFVCKMVREQKALPQIADVNMV